MSRAISVVFGGLLALARGGIPIVRDNKVDFPGSDSLKWTETSHSISTGQTYDGVSVQGNTINIRAGRHGSAEVASDFNAGLDFDHHIMGLHVVKANRPELLNFVSFGTLTAHFPSGETKSCENMRLAQGRSGAYNNWWLASDQCIMVTSVEFACEKCGLTFFVGNNDHQFRLGEVTGAGVHHNYVLFPGVLGIQWAETSHSITSGQNYDGTFAHGTQLDIKAGRHESKQPADDFFSGLNFNTHIMGLDTSAAKPERLNFVSFGTLTATFLMGVSKRCANMRIGQGHAGLKNNWWIASPDCEKVSTDEFACEKCGVAFSSGKSDYQFSVRSLDSSLPLLASTHYGNPLSGSCLSDEQGTEVPGVPGSFCSAQCDENQGCPLDKPIGVWAKPGCDVRENRCRLRCVPYMAQCGLSGRCQLTGMASGVCTYQSEDIVAPVALAV